MHPLVITMLRVALAVLGAGLLGAQIIIAVVTTMSIAATGTVLPDLGFAAAGIAAMACVQVGLVAIWVLLSMVRRGAIFDERAFRWVPVIAAAGLLAAAIVGSVCVYIGRSPDGPPGLALIGGGIGMAGIAFALLMTVMLGLLRNATVLRRELEQVV